VVKRGIQDGVQVYWCKEGNHRFRNERKSKEHLIELLWHEYVFNKQTIRELHDTHHLDKKTIVAYLNKYLPDEKIHRPRPVYLVADATYFGTRLDRTAWCIVVFRDPEEKENLWWTYGSQETAELYWEGREHLEALGYTIRSVTGDGFSGLRSGFSGIPFQMCHVHMERIVVRGTTRNPKLIQGQVLLALVKTLYTAEEEVFTRRVNQYTDMNREFLNQKTVREDTGEWDYTHKELRGAALSLLKFLPYLFTYKRDVRIPPTTNSLEGHFRHVKEIVAIHGGLSKSHKKRVLDTIMLEGSIVPKKKKSG
jgi:hypothetical protein